MWSLRVDIGLMAHNQTFYVNLKCSVEDTEISLKKSDKSHVSPEQSLQTTHRFSKWIHISYWECPFLENGIEQKRWIREKDVWDS